MFPALIDKGPTFVLSAMFIKDSSQRLFVKSLFLVYNGNAVCFSCIERGFLPRGTFDTRKHKNTEPNRTKLDKTSSPCCDQRGNCNLVYKHGKLTSCQSFDITKFIKFLFYLAADIFWAFSGKINCV